MINIRLADVSDIPSIVALTTTLCRKCIAPDCTAAGAERLLASMGPEDTTKRFAGSFRYFVACDGGQVIGVIAMRENSHLFHLFVATSHQRRGIARALWRIAQQSCLDAGNSGHFTVNSSRAARPVYKAFGFVGEGEACIDGVPFIPMTLDTTIN